MFYKHPVSPNAVRIKQSLCLKLTFQIQRVATAKQFQRSKTVLPNGAILGKLFIFSVFYTLEDLW